MSSSTACGVVGLSPLDRLDALFDELSQLAGQRNAIDGRIVQIAAELDRHQLLGITGARSVAALMAWKTGCSPNNAQTITAIAERLDDFPRCVAGLQEGRLSLDQVGVIAERAGQGSDDHYAELARYATVTQLRTAVKLEPRPTPEPDPRFQPRATISKGSDEQYTWWRIKLPHLEAATFDAALQSHLDALVADYKRDHDTGGQDGHGGQDGRGPGGPGGPGGHEIGERATDTAAPFPTTIDAFMRLVEAGFDAEAAARPHGHRTTVIAHLDVKDKIAALHLGPLLSEAERQYLLCDATCEVWFHRDGQPIGAGRTTRLISRRLRRALEHRHPTCAVPGCGATRGLHAHHLRHWEHGGLTELDNLVLLCPYHHRLHHRGGITITGPAPRITVTDRFGRQLSSASLARPPTQPPPAAPPYRGPTGERADWWWYDPYEPPAPDTN
ncbi:HNH endonuclease [Mycobacterium sp. Y57]|uniref:HNH endonuclease signature motif containing protein n=1 Tax=Mycolicibacterium xanthum TaxID=2796469 RepID=UPI001C85D90D|nr:HNH endonuclease signature motif containing protein [Mycolicibacterium xanthum]MBX7432778.1 HNH endonuclease [Mycolicibacterium xanthum]